MPDDAVARSILQDPRYQYPQPPFPKQPQSPPGLAARMDPKPDHGETSYVGHNRLMGRKALVTGGDSGIGRAAALAFAREGADVAIAFMQAEAADAEEVIARARREGRSPRLRRQHNGGPLRGRGRERPQREPVGRGMPYHLKFG